MNRESAIKAFENEIHTLTTDSVYRAQHGEKSPHLAVAPAYRIMQLIEKEMGAGWDELKQIHRPMERLVVLPVNTITEAQHSLFKAKDGRVK